MIKRHLTKYAAAASALLVLGLSAHTSRAATSAPDLDGDGVPNIVDTDIDNDGIPNALDSNIDGGIAKSGPHAGQYIGDHVDNDSPAEKDIDGDGQTDDSLAERDVDGDTKKDDDATELDIDGDRRNDDSPSEMDIDGDGTKDDEASEDDIDGDSLSDDDDTEMDIDGDGKDDDSDDDIDGDGKSNDGSVDDDTDGDGTGNGDAMDENDDGDSLGDRMDDDDDNDGDDDSDDGDHHDEDDEQEVEISLTKAASAPADSRCRVKIQRMANGKVDLELDGRDFPAGAYDVTVDGTLIGQLQMVDDNGDLEGEQQWETNANDSDEINLTIDVINKPITVSKAGVTYFTGTVPTPPAPGDPPPPPVVAESDLTPGPAAPANADGTIQLEAAPGDVELQFEVENLVDGAYDLLIDGALRATFMVEDGQAQLKFDTSPKTEEGEIALDFDYAGLSVSVAQGANVFFTGTIPLSPGDGGTPGDGEDNGGADPLIAALSPTPDAPAAANGEIQLQFGAAGVVGFEIEAEDLADGVYTLTVGEVVRGELTVTLGHGKLRFETHPDTSEEQLLSFAVAGLPVSLSQNGVAVLTGTAPNAPEA